ncbi:J domain-containing protein [Natrialbaceae archaeon A-CW1-1]
MESHYDVLGVSPDADLDEIRAAYRRLLKRHHPDQGGSRDQFLRIKQAYETVVGEHPDEGLVTARYPTAKPTGRTIHRTPSRRGRSDCRSRERC